MKPILFAVLIGSIIATAYSAPAPSKLQALMQDADDDDVAKMQKWFGIAKRVIGGLNTAVNGEKRAQLESDDPSEQKGDQEVARLVDEIIMRIIEAEEEKDKLKREEGEDKEGTGDKCNDGEGGEGSEGSEGEEGSEDGEGSEGGEGGEGSEGEDNMDKEEVMNCIRQRVQEMRQKGDADSKQELARNVLKCIRMRVDELHRTEGGSKADAQFLGLALGAASLVGSLIG